MVGTAVERHAVPTMNPENPHNENDPAPEPQEGGPEQAAPERPEAGEQPAPERSEAGEQPAPERPAAGPEPTAEQPTAAAPPTATAQAGPRRLYRSRSDRVIWGVC